MFKILVASLLVILVLNAVSAEMDRKTQAVWKVHAVSYFIQSICILL